MALTPQMKHSIKLLSMSTKELHEYINTVAESNPFLQKILNEKVTRTSHVYEYNDGASKDEEDSRSSLLSQLRMLNLSDKEMEIVEYLIYEMDENGYITTNLEEAAADLAVALEEVESALEAIQSLEPAGIGAQDISECLQLQLKRMAKEGSLEYRMVTECISEVAKNDVEKIARLLMSDKEEVKSAIANIKKLNPRPASTILSKKAEDISPDFVVRFRNKKVQLELNKNWLPRLRLYNPYENKVDIIKDADARRFMKENMDLAKNLIDGVRRREETMCRVADYILTYHKDSLQNKPHEIKSLTVKDISKALNIHPSTVTRTIANKYIQIYDKVMPLKSLLSAGITKDGGDSVSKTAVKKRIESLIKNEDKARPLTDGAIQDIFSKEGIPIKRRTIAKYRDSLRILPAYFRKK
jgi:RNA polymerase sigma-54 factor